MRKIKTFCLFFFAVFSLNSQEDLSRDELSKMLGQKQPDSTLVDIYNELCWPVYSYSLYDSAIYYGEKAVLLSEKINDAKRLSIAYRRLGITYGNKGDLKKSVLHQQKSFELSKQIGFERGCFLALNNLGVAYLNNELLNLALPNFLKSLRYVEKTNDYGTISRVSNNCGQIYRRIKDEKMATRYYRQALKNAELANENALVVSAYSNLSASHRIQKNYDSAVYYLQLARKKLEANSSDYARYSYYAEAGIFEHIYGRQQQALVYFDSASHVLPGFSEKLTLMINRAEAYRDSKKYTEAIRLYKDAFALSEENKMFDNLEFISTKLADIYKSKGELDGFVKYIQLQISYNDSNEQLNRAHQLLGQQLQFDFDTKRIADSLNYVQREKLKNAALEISAAKLEREKVLRTLLIAVCLMIILFAVFFLNRLLLTRRQKKIIEEQKALVELRNQEMVDSITYAKRLQEAILPPIDSVKAEYNADVLFIPKDIIGGDFYFLEDFGDHLFYAVCDCTGHGVPGALMSVVCHQAIRKAIHELDMCDPGLILNKAREHVIKSLNASKNMVRDGMDASLLVLDKRTGKWMWAGANNSLVYIEDKVAVELKADKQPIAFSENAKSFTTHHLSVQKGTRFYLSSDGFADQFGGPRGKKYKSQALKRFITGICTLFTGEQVKALASEFSEWKGGHDQVDDITIMVVNG
jgi:serine phosphatase RsbU (regulator of sigma subunit)